MFRVITIFVFIMIFFSGFGQARRDADGIYYDKQGQIFTGTCYEYISDSLIRATFEIIDGKLDGLTRVYFSGGQLEEIRSFKEGMMHGKWEKWNQQQVKIAEANYTDNLKDGKWFIWDDNGTLRYDMNYNLGKKSGTWMMYDEQGILTDQKSY